MLGEERGKEVGGGVSRRARPAKPTSRSQSLSLSLSLSLYLSLSPARVGRDLGEMGERDRDGRRAGAGRRAASERARDHERGAARGARDAGGEAGPQRQFDQNVQSGVVPLGREG
jgi:hypothetical protein